MTPTDGRSESNAWKTLFCLSLINSTQSAIAVVGIPAHAKDAGLESLELALLLGIFPVAAGFSAFCAGPISDLLGRRTTLISGLIALGTALAMHAFADSVPFLAALRLATGLATGALTGIPSALLSDNFGKNRQQELTAKMLCGYAIGQTIGIPGGIAILEWISFTHLCSYLGLMALALAPFARYYLPERNPSRFCEREWLAEYLRNALASLRSTSFSALAVSSFLSFTALSLFYVSFALWLFNTAQLRPFQIAPMYLGGGLLQVAVFVFIIPRVSKCRIQNVVAISLAANTLLFAISYPLLQSLALAASLFALTLGVVSLRVPGFQFLINNSGDPQQKGLRMSVIQTCNHLGKAAGAVAASASFNHLQMHQIALICGALTLISTAPFLLKRRNQHFTVA